MSSKKARLGTDSSAERPTVAAQRMRLAGGAGAPAGADAYAFNPRVRVPVGHAASAPEVASERLDEWLDQLGANTLAATAAPGPTRPPAAKAPPAAGSAPGPARPAAKAPAAAGPAPARIPKRKGAPVGGKSAQSKSPSLGAFFATAASEGAPPPQAPNAAEESPAGVTASSASAQKDSLYNEKLAKENKMREEGEAIYRRLLVQRESALPKRWLFLTPESDREASVFAVEAKATPAEMLGGLRRADLISEDVARALTVALVERGRAVGARARRSPEDPRFGWAIDPNMEGSFNFFTKSIPEWGEPGRYRALVVTDREAGAVQVSVSDSDLGEQAFVAPFIFVNKGDATLGDNIADCTSMFEMVAKLNKLSVADLKSVYEFVVSCAEGLRTMDLTDEPYFDSQTLEWHRISRIVQFPPGKKPASKRDLVREIARMASGLHFDELSKPVARAAA